MTTEQVEPTREGRIWFLKTSALFEEMTESILDWAGMSSRETEFQRGDLLPIGRDENARIYVIVEGQIKLRAFSESGKEQILDIASAGDTFGPIERLFEGDRISSEFHSSMATEAVALSKGLALAFRLGEFRDLVERRPNVILNVSRLLGLKQRRLEIRLARLLYRSSLGKLAGLLSELAERYGVPTDEGILLPFKLTHQEMASIVGSKRETVSEGMGILELQETIRTQKGEIVILRPADLDSIL
jgi:CRP-like cAMP-binding protein